MSSVEQVIAGVADHIRGFVERPHPAFAGQPVCPFARRARAQNRVETVVVPYTAADDSAVTWAVEQFDPAADKDVLLVVHPDPVGLGFADLDELRSRFAARLAGRYEVFTGHPSDPFTRAGVRTRAEPYPTLHFVRSDRLADAERRLGGFRRGLGAGRLQ